MRTVFEWLERWTIESTSIYIATCTRASLIHWKAFDEILARNILQIALADWAYTSRLYIIKDSDSA